MLIDIRYNDIYLSIASLWEIEIKHIKHPQEMPYSAKEIYNDAKTSYKFLSIDQNHVQELSSLDDIHSDPFDKILMAQAKAESLEFVTADEKIAQYGYSFIVPFRHL